MSSQRIRDPLHDLVVFETGSNQLERVLWNVMQTRPFQRLRRVKQLGFADLVYPGATHSRFAHSVGVFHTARRLIDVIRRHQTLVEDSKINHALAAALVHDLGHGPFSHAFESVGKRLGLKVADHEHVSDVLIRTSEIADALQDLGSGFANDVADVIKGRGKSNIYRAVVSSQFDADRLDYMRRDRLMAGSQHAGIDFEWLLANLEIGTVSYGVDQQPLGQVETFVLGPKAFYAAEAYVLGLFQLYPTVYFHKTSRGAEMLFTELLTRVVTLVRDDAVAKTGLPDRHPLIRFAREPEDVESALVLDDTVVWGALTLMVDAEDTCVASFAKRLRDRKLYKCIDVRTKVAHALGEDDDGLARTDKACAIIEARITEWPTRSIDYVPRALIDKEMRSPYKRIEESKGPLDQINIRTPGGQLVDLAKHSKVVAASETFKLFRVYVPEQDEGAVKFVEEVVQGAIS